MTSDIVKKKVGRPSKGKRGTFTFRVSAALRDKLEAAAASNARSVSEEIEFRINRDFGWEATRQDIEGIKRQALVWADASRAKAIREAGLQILREIEGNPKRVIVDLETLLAEADGIARGYRAGFVDDNAPAVSDRPLTKEEADRVLAEIDEFRRSLEAAQERAGTKPRSENQ